MNWIKEYNDLIQSGEIITSRRVKAVYARLAAATDHCGSDSPNYFDEAKGERPIAFIERFCRHSKGEWAGRPVRLELFQKAFIQALFGFVDQDGNRQYKESMFLVGRKNGKSTLMSGLALYMATADGEGGAEVYSTATKRDQAKLLFDEACNMVDQSPALKRHFKKREDDLYYIPTRSIIKPLSSRSGTQDGLNAHCVVMDELHAITDRNQYEVLRQSMGARRQPLLLMITTAGTVRESIFDDMYSYASSLADGTATDDHFLPILYELDDRSEWEDPASWIKANPGLDAIKKRSDLALEVNRAKQEVGNLPGVLCKHFNIISNTRSAWLPFDAINNTDTFDMEDLRGCWAIAGVDLSKAGDLTAACLLIMRPGDETKYIASMFWLPEDKLDEHVKIDKVPYDRWVRQGYVRLCSGNSIRYTDVTQWFLEMFRQYDLQPTWIYYDSWSSRYFVDEMAGYGLTLIPCIQGYKTLSLPMQRLGADLQRHGINYNNNPVMKWCLSNTGVRTDANGNIAPIKNSSPRQRIDGLAAMLDAYVGFCEHEKEFVEAVG